MFARRPQHSDSFSSRYGAGKSTKTKTSFKEKSIKVGLERTNAIRHSPRNEHTSPPIGE